MSLSSSSFFSESEIQGNETLFRNILDKLPIGAYACDNSGLITYFNPAVEQIWGRAPKLNNPQYKYCGAYKLLDSAGNYISNDQSFVAKSLEYQDDYSGFEMIVEQPDGKQLNVLGYSNPMFDESGSISGVVTILVDFTYQKMAEEEKHKREKRKLYSKKLESLGALSSGVAHNFSNLLTAILGNTNLAMMEVEQDSSVYKKLAHIEETAESAALLSRRMLAYSGEGRFLVEIIQIDDLVRRLISRNDEVVFEQAIIKLNLQPAHIIGDINELSQLINNLFTNALEALNDNPGNINITTGMRYATREDLESPHFPKPIPTGNYAFFVIQDSGEGMDEDTMSKIFDPFFSTRFAGRGLGLAAALGIVSGHSGVIQVTSKPGKGSTFEVLLPCEDTVD